MLLRTRICNSNILPLTGFFKSNHRRYMVELLSIRRQTLDIKINQFKKSLEEELEKNSSF